MSSQVGTISIDEYDRMIARGDFESPGKRVRLELIYGELVDMTPIGPLHEDSTWYLMEWSFEATKRLGLLTRIQHSLGIPELDSAPEPDLVWVPKKRYRQARPLASTALLVIEVSDSSLRFDRKVKGPLYAKAGVQEYWIVNCIDRCVEVHREPTAEVYADRFVAKPGDILCALAAPDAPLDLIALFADEASA